MLANYTKGLYASYGISKKLTAHYYNCKLIGNTIYSRFKWFDNENIRGYSIYEIVNEKKIVGGWWMEEDIPENYREYDNLSKFKD